MPDIYIVNSAFSLGLTVFFIGVSICAGFVWFIESVKKRGRR